MIENSDYFLLIVYSLATWRISSLLVNEIGPYAILLRLRVLFGVEYWTQGLKEVEISCISDNFDNWLNEEESFFIVYRNEFSKLFSCVWCMSIWVSLCFIFSEFILPLHILNIIRIFALWMAISALSIKISEI
jgi:hypothetical protein